MSDPSAKPPPDDREFLREFLAGRDVECPQCHYNLRDLPGDRCPECGEALTLRINMVEPKLAAPIAGLVGLAAGAGLNALLLLYWFLMVLFYDRRSGEMWNKFVAVNLFNLIGVGCAICVWLKMWRRIRAASARVRWSLVAGCFALSLVDLVIFAVKIR